MFSNRFVFYNDLLRAQIPTPFFSGVLSLQAFACLVQKLFVALVDPPPLPLPCVKRQSFDELSSDIRSSDSLSSKSHKFRAICHVQKF